MNKRIKIFDTTLRDGEQTPGVNFNIREKIDIAKQLAILGVDVMEAGFPNASQGDFAAVSAIAKEVKGITVAGLCRTIPADIQRAWEALKHAESPRIHTFIATSEIHMQYKLRMSEEEVLEKAINAVKLAKGFCDNVEFSLEDATRSNPEFMYRVIEKVIQAGAIVVNIPDTVGYIIPEEYTAMIKGIFNNVPNIDKAEISVHCHNDLGMAVANSLAAVKAGARQIECTINGVGERAGNASMEEIVMALNTRNDFFGFTTNINSNQIYRTSRLVSNYTGMEIPANKAIVGDNAFRHESGIHQHGVLNSPSTYEIMTPDSIGLYNVEGMVLGKLSGRHAFEEKIKELGYHLEAEELKETFTKFKDLADRKKDISARDIEALLEDKFADIPSVIELVDYQIFSGNRTSATATVQLTRGEEKMQEAAMGDGPIDAAYHAIERILNIELTLESYGLKAVTGGKDALGEVTVKVKYKNDIYLGRGISTDIIEASILSYINAINKIMMDNPQVIGK